MQMLTEQYIDESIIPMNMGWRAGIGQDRDYTSISGQSVNMHSPVHPYQNSINSPYNMEDPLLPGREELWDGGIRLTYSKNNKNNVPLGEVPPSFYQDLMYQIESEVKDVQDSYNGKVLDSRTSFEYRDKLKKVCLGIKRKYGQYLNDKFYDNLYNKCMNEYNQEFANLKLGCNPTVEFIDAHQKIYANPLLIYQYFQL